MVLHPRRTALLVLLVLLPSFFTPPAHVSRAASAHAQTLRSSALFVENVGQFGPGPRFQLLGGTATLWLADDALWLTVVEPAPNVEPQPPERPDPHPSRPRRGTNLRLSFADLNPAARLTPLDPQPTRVSYLRGAARAAWRADLPTYAAVRWEQVLPGVSLVVHGLADAIRLSVEAHPGTDLSALRMQVAGAESLQLDQAGRLFAATAGGPVLLPMLHGADGLALRPQLDGLSATFAPAAPAPVSVAPALIQDTALLYATFFGASEDDGAYAFGVGPDGAAYVGGNTFSFDFPTTPGAFDTEYQTEGQFGGDVFVSKWSPAGTLVYSTFLGGNDTDYGNALAVGADGSAYIAGWTHSNDFPTTAGAYDPNFDGGCCDAYVARLNPAGSDLVYGTFVGGDGLEILAGLTLSGDMAYITGETLSPDFPTTPGAYDTTLGAAGYSDAFVAAISANGDSLAYGSFLGGTYNDYGEDIAIGSDDTIYVTGQSIASDFPTTPGAFDQSANGGNDVFVTRLAPNGSALVYSTLIGGNEYDYGNALAVGTDGSAYVVGSTPSPNFPTTPDAFSTVCGSCSQYYSDAFMLKLKPKGEALVYSSFLGAEDGDFAIDLSLTPEDVLYFSGYTYSLGFPTTPDAQDHTLGGYADAFIGVFYGAQNTLVYSSLFGGDGVPGGYSFDYGLGIEPAGDQMIYLAGVTGAADFPATPDAFDTRYNGSKDAFLAKLRLVPEPQTLLVADITPSYRQLLRRYLVGAQIQIADSNGEAVPGANVLLEITLPNGEVVAASGTTDASGVASVQMPSRAQGVYTFTVTGVSKAGALYEPQLNTETSDSIHVP